MKSGEVVPDVTSTLSAFSKTVCVYEPSKKSKLSGVSLKTHRGSKTATELKSDTASSVMDTLPILVTVPPCKLDKVRVPEVKH